MFNIELPDEGRKSESSDDGITIKEAELRGSSSSENSWEEDKKDIEKLIDDTKLKLRENWKAHLKVGEQIILSNWGHFNVEDPNDATMNFFWELVNRNKRKVILIVDGKFTVLESFSTNP